MQRILHAQAVLLRQDVLFEVLHRIFRADDFILRDINDGRAVSDAGTHPEDALLLLGVLRGIQQQLRARPDEGHVALQDIEQLRQFIKFQAAHDLARAGNAAVVERRAAAGLIRPDDHRAEFIDIERLIMVSTAHRLIQHRAGAVELDPNGQRQHDDAAGDEQNQRKQEVDDALDNMAVKRMGQRPIPARHLRKWLL